LTRKIITPFSSIKAKPQTHNPKKIKINFNKVSFTSVEGNGRLKIDSTKITR
jgi:hypothetical protein